MRKIKVLGVVLLVSVFVVSSCAQKPCPTYSKAEIEYQKKLKKDTQL